MAFNIGLNVIEVDGLGSPAIVSAATSIGAFNVTTRRGVVNRPVMVTSFAQFVDRFGSYFPQGLGAYLVKGFFDNGGQVAFINRVIAGDTDEGARHASLRLKDAANDTLELTAGYRGSEDPGAWGNDIFVAVDGGAETAVRLRETKPATLTGAVLAATVDMTALPPLSVLVDGESTATVLKFRESDFPGGRAAATAAQIRDAINRQTTKLVASLTSDNKLVLTSSGATAKMRRDFSRLQVSAANATLGMTALGAIVGDAAPATTTGTRLADLSPFAIGDALLLTDGTNNATVKLTSMDPITSEIVWEPAVTTINTFDAHKLQVSRVTFNLRVALGAPDNAHVVETRTGLSMQPSTANYVVSVLNDPITGSKYLTAADLHSARGAGANVPALDGWARLAGGNDGVPTSREFIGDQAARTGFFAFDATSVQLVTCERNDPAVTTAALAYCAARGDCMYIGSVPQNFPPESAIAYGKVFQGKKVSGALYGPWVVVADPIGPGTNPVKSLPPVGHVMGIYARIETTRGIWKAPAGDEANLLGVLDVEYSLSDAEHTQLVKEGSVNGIRAVPRAGIIVDASRTLSTDTRWLYVNVRLLFNYVKSSLKTGLSWTRQEPNRDSLWSAVKLQSVTPFLMGLWRQGAFGAGTPAQVFTVICDASNNPPDQVDQGNLKVEVYFYPSKPAETIVIVVGQQPSGATASEA